MESVQLQYRCSLCGQIFQIPSKLSLVEFEQLMDSYLYNTDPPVVSLKESLSDYEKHKCPNDSMEEFGVYIEDRLDRYKRFGIGKLIGYSITETPDPKKPKLRKVK